MLVNGLFGFFFFTSLKPAEFAGEGCLADNYYGTYGNTGLFLLRPESQCLASLLATAPPGFVEEGVLIAKGDQQLMYIHKLPIQDDTDSLEPNSPKHFRVSTHTPQILALTPPTRKPPSD
jgi:hypothetical protein